MMRFLLVLFIAIWTGSTMGADVVRPPTESPHVKMSAEVEQDLWDNIKGSSDPAVFEAYLKEYPKGHFASVARVMVTKFKASSAKPEGAPASTPPSLGRAEEIASRPRFYIADSKGCKVFNPHPEPNQTINWSGSCKDGYADGPGRLEWFKNHVPDGVYVGEFNSGIRNGQGTHYYPDGARYEGEYLDDQFNGQGTFSYAEGGRYVGAWRGGKRNGTGKLTFTNGARFEGEFKDDEITGQGTLYYADGSRYLGTWRNGKRDGKGTQYFANGGRYEGEFANDQFNGHGTIYYADGDRYEGAWRNGKRNGRGMHYSANGDRYEGEFTDDRRTGQGTYYYAKGMRYEGEFLDGNRHGQGTYYYPNGDLYKPPGWYNNSACTMPCP